MENKKASFLLYNSFYEPIKQMSMEERGMILTAIFEYNVNGQMMDELPNGLKIAFLFMKKWFDEDREKYLKTCSENKENATKRWGNATALKKIRPHKKTSARAISSKINADNDAEYDEDVTDDETGDDDVHDDLNDDDKKNENVKKKKAKEKKVRCFIKPTIEEIDAYCQERQNGVDAFTFFNFYEAKGWRIGKDPVRSWKACVHTWEHRNGYFNEADADKTTPNKVPIKQSDEDLKAAFLKEVCGE